MRAHYDLSKSPATHDFVCWLARAELKRREMGDEWLEVNIIPGTRDQSIRDKTLSVEQRAWTARTLLPQLAWLLPSVRNVTWDRLGIQNIPYGPLPRWPGNLLRASDHARTIVRGYLKDKPRPVSITIRNSSFQPERNGRHVEWTRVVSRLWANGCSPIFVPDTEQVLSGGHHPAYPHDTYTAASMSSDIRLALYEQCEMNFMTTGGPVMLALLGDVRAMVFKMVVPGIATCEPPYLMKGGFANGQEWAPGKTMFWKDDTKSNVMQEVWRWLGITAEQGETA